MKALIAGLVIGTSLFGGTALADPIHIETAALALDNLPAFGDDRVSVLASGADALQLSLAGMLDRNSRSGAGWSAYDDQGVLQQATSVFDTGYQLSVHAGYRITSVDWTFTVAGQLLQAQLPPSPDGQATNASNESMSLSTSSTVLGSDWRQVANLDGTQQLQLTFAGLALAQDAILALHSDVAMAAQGIPPGGILPGIPSFASMNLSDAVLTIRTQPFAMPVPEPASYAMLFAGLGLIVAIARRRQGSKY